MGKSAHYSHSTSKSGRVEYLSSHLDAVAKRASEYAEAFGASDEALIAGLLHDLGKYGDLFQKRLEGKERGIDHWSPGAWTSLMNYQEYGKAAAVAIQGHHIGLQKGDNDSLRDLAPEKLQSHHPLSLRLSSVNIEKLLDRFKADGLKLPPSPQQSLFPKDSSDIKAAVMLNIRMLYSTLVDADFIETEAHFQAEDNMNRCYRSEGSALQADKALQILLELVQKLSDERRASDKVMKMRRHLLKVCLTTASESQGLFTLTAPTGAGKTLSMLAFALEHARIHDLRKVVVVIPFLSIIEQTAQVYRHIFQGYFRDEYILEDHSLAGTKHDENNVDSDLHRLKNQLAANWDAPIVVTTSVQFLESLFSNRPSACRKLHRLAKSVILFDEVQTLPLKVVVPTLATLSHLAERFHSSVVFATATQPAFTELHKHVKTFCGAGWTPREIVPPNLDLFAHAKRTTVHWPISGTKLSWDELKDEIRSHEQVLCVVNLKRHAHDLFDRISLSIHNNVFHLSTNMCPVHRHDVLEKVREKLKHGEPCRLISTQCVEAGVDVDFPVVCRALGPMDAIAQAAGRCNRNGKAESGQVIVFEPDDEFLYPTGAYSQAAGVTKLLLNEFDEEPPDINNPELFKKYYRTLYSFRDLENENKDLSDAIKRLDFAAAAKEYRIIDNKASINVLVPYQGALDKYEDLKADSETNGLTRRWIARARPYSISLYKPGKFENYLKPIDVRFGKSKGASEDWYIYLNKEHYDYNKGLVPPSDELLIA